VALYHERHGAGEPLLLITGWTISAAVFEPVLGAYAEHFECISYDHRGSARSDGSPPSRSPHTRPGSPTCCPAND